MSKIKDNGTLREMTASEQAEYDAMQIEYENRKNLKKLEQIREIRNQKLSETDWLVISEQVTEAEKTWRENLRKIPQDYSADKYNELLARDINNNLTHNVWSKP